MKLEEYLKNNFADVSGQKPIDISQDVLKRLPKYNLGPFTDPLVCIICISAVLLLAGVSAAVIVQLEKKVTAPVDLQRPPAQRPLPKEQDSPEKTRQTSRPSRPEGRLWWRELRQDEAR